MTKIQDILISSGDYICEVLELQEPIKPGQNGPWNDQMTSMRVMSHWSILLLQVYKLTGKDKYKIYAKKILDDIINPKQRPKGFSFYSRISDTKDASNGLVGQAWVIEALLYGYKILEDNKYIKLAEEIFLLHRFNKSKGLWFVLDVDGEANNLCLTTNQQIWFATLGTILFKETKNKKIDYETSIFWNQFYSNVALYHTGLIKHLVKIKSFKSFLKSQTNKLRDLSIGYHSFNLYALAILKDNVPELSFWSDYRTEKFIKKIINALSSSTYKKNIYSNEYSFQYNIPGIELFYFKEVFEDYFTDRQRKDIEEYFEFQISNHICSKTLLLNKNTVDPDTLAARSYELTRLNSNIPIYMES
ncbi:hypothetical protein P4644_11085 [Priestia aryabhattai]|uniref:hypothetical protein n=1 Tax=Priestia TaxID=2800373 RepID=UPI00257059AB|nr:MULTISPECIES: hypothetical protein [Priestia]MED3920221.1 hypothetical protein [Priestia aryabhattai]WJD81991.1 hypothetical protein QRD24_05720 [Priestia megaterium]